MKPDTEKVNGTIDATLQNGTTDVTVDNSKSSSSTIEKCLILNNVGDLRDSK